MADMASDCGHRDGSWLGYGAYNKFRRLLSALAGPEEQQTALSKSRRSRRIRAEGGIDNYRYLQIESVIAFVRSAR